VFRSGRNAAMPIRSMQNAIAALVRQASLARSDITAHSLRHTFALAWLRQHPGQLIELSQLLGHVSLDTTAVYTRAAEPWSLTSLLEKLIKIGAEVVSHGRYVTLPDGRGRGPTTDVPGNFVADRPVADPARASMRSAGIRCDKRRQQKCATKQAKLRVSAPRRSQLLGSSLAAHAVRDLPLPTTGEGAILGPTTTPNIREMSDYTYNERRGGRLE
jgi:hypothetical protein